jgi:adenosylhomocysteine nucleosidase
VIAQDKKPIGIVCALTKEVEGFHSYWEKNQYQTFNIKGRTFYQGLIGDKKTIIVESGWGKVRAASAAQLLLDQFSPAAIINVGVAGAINPQRGIGDIILSEATLEYDFRSGELVGQKPKKADDNLLQLALKGSLSSPYQSQTFTGLIISGDQDINSRTKKQFLWQRYKAECGEWEGAAIATVAKINKISWLIIRSISDLAEEHFASEFEKNVALAARNSADIAARLLNEII